jgi:hypothetical protein
VTLTGCIPGMLKSKDLFVGKTRKQMGLDAWAAAWGIMHFSNSILPFPDLQTDK